MAALSSSWPSVHLSWPCGKLLGLFCIVLGDILLSALTFNQSGGRRSQTYLGAFIFFLLLTKSKQRRKRFIWLTHRCHSSLLREARAGARRQKLKNLRGVLLTGMAPRLTFSYFLLTTWTTCPGEAPLTGLSFQCQLHRLAPLNLMETYVQLRCPLPKWL